MDSDDTANEPVPRDTITLRATERAQLTEFLPALIDLYEQQELPEKITSFESIQDMVTADGDAPIEYDFGHRLIQDLVVGLEELDSTRASWLRAKIGRRAECKPIHMGFISRVPPMAMVTGETPTRPD